MKKNCIVIICSLIVIFCVYQILFNLYKYENIKKQINNEFIQIQSEIGNMKKTKNYGLWSKNLISQNNKYSINVENSNLPEENRNEILLQNDIIGILEIPKLNIQAPIKDGTSQDIIKYYIGHFKESNYWNGNVSLASHNGGTYAHYFKNIHLLQKNDEIYYTTKMGTRIYKVQSINKIKSTDWSMINSIKNTNQNTLNLVTCINGLPNFRICVRALEI